MKIGDAAKEAGVSVSALRKYEDRGLIAAGRTAGGTRLYTEEDVARFRAIVAMARVDVPLDELAALAAVRPSHLTGDTASRKVGALLAAMEVELESRIDKLAAVLVDLRQTQEKLAGCHGCPKAPNRSECNGCAVAEGLLEQQVMRIVWDQKHADA